jgi:hypothetical protein
MGNNHDYNIDCRGLQVLMIIILSFPFMVAIAAEAEIATSSGTNNPTLENDSYLSSLSRFIVTIRLNSNKKYTR